MRRCCMSDVVVMDGVFVPTSQRVCIIFANSSSSTTSALHPICSTQQCTQDRTDMAMAMEMTKTMARRRLVTNSENPRFVGQWGCQTARRAGRKA